MALAEKQLSKKADAIVAGRKREYENRWPRRKRTF